MPSGLDQIWIALDSRNVALTSASRWALLARMQQRPFGASEQNEAVLEAFRRVGVDRPVRLDTVGRAHLFAILAYWSLDNHLGLAALPKGMLRLLNPLRHDVRAAEQQTT